MVDGRHERFRVNRTLPDPGCEAVVQGLRWPFGGQAAEAMADPVSSPLMPMRATTVRFGDDLWGLLERESARHGISAAQFVRDSTILRIAFLAAERGDAEARLTLAGVAAGALADRIDPPAPGVSDPGRLAAVRATGLLDAPVSPALDRLARVAARVVDAPVALVSIVDHDRQVFPGCCGLDEPWLSRRETPLSYSLCQHAIDTREPLVLDDAREHPALRDSGAVRELEVIAYAGIPLIGDDGHVLGTLCVIDHRPRAWTSEQIDVLRDLAHAVMTEIRTG
jgi:GAF domain-containing protein